MSRDARQTSAALRGLDRVRGRLGSGPGLSVVGAGATGAAIAGVYGLGRGIKLAGEEYAESARVAATTNAIIKSTGGIAGISAGHVDKLSSSLSRKTGLDDEAIASGSNLLLTFKGIRSAGGIFDRATASAVDLSAAGFGSIDSASKMLGKSLNDPVKGITALSRAGVTFSEDQKATITRLAETGHTLAAQKMIMREVESQVKGTAAAQRTPIMALRTNWANLAETMGTLGAPAANKGLGVLARYVHQIDSIAGRKNIDLGEKLRLSGTAARSTFGPLVTEGRKTVARMHLGQKLEDAVVWAAPKIADGMAKAAPRAASAFVHAFADAGVWGKLVMGGLLFSKMGGVAAFAGLGRRAGRSMRGGLKGTAAGALGAGCCAPMPGRKSPTSKLPGAAKTLAPLAAAAAAAWAPVRA